jgi:hypothetical protein
MLPAQPREAIEVRVGRDQDAAVLDCNGGVLRICDESRARARTAAEILEDLEVERPGMDDPGVRPGDELADESEGFVQR